MRLKAQVWVQAYIRICAAADCQAYVVRHGDDDAGMLLIKINHLDGTGQLYGPAPISLTSDADGQRFSAIFGNPQTRESDIDRYVAEQATFDPDLWLVEVEDAKRRHFLDGWLDRS